MFCGEDEFYDGVVGLCSKCSDICAVVNDFCTVNCPGYKHQLMGSSTGSRHVVTSSAPVAAAVAKRSDSIKLLLTKPLFWTSVSSLCVSVVATTVLVVLCVCHRRRRPAIPPRRRVRQLIYSTAESPSRDKQLQPTTHNDGSDKMLRSDRSTVNIIYSDSRLCSGDVTLAISMQAQESACISLYSGDNMSDFSLDRNNISGVTDHPHSSHISWIDFKHQSIDLRDVGDDASEDESQCEEDTALKANWAPDELRRCDSVDALNASVTDCMYQNSTSHCVDLDTSLTKLSAILSRKENSNRTPNLDIHRNMSVISDRQRELIESADSDSGCDAEDDVIGALSR